MPTNMAKTLTRFHPSSANDAAFTKAPQTKILVGHLIYNVLLDCLKDTSFVINSTQMFRNIFSFEGRIRRTEYGLTIILYMILSTVLQVFTKPMPIVGLVYIPVIWILWAQGAKRCHDKGLNGWYQLIPFFFLYLIFADSDYGPNKYGLNPKELGNDLPNPAAKSDDFLDFDKQA